MKTAKFLLRAAAMATALSFGSIATAHAGMFDPLLCEVFGKACFPGTTAVRQASPAALDAVSRIVGAVGLVQNFSVLDGDFTASPIAYATVVRRQRFIVYDKEQFFWKNGRPGWNEITILVH